MQHRSFLCFLSVVLIVQNVDATLYGRNVDPNVTPERKPSLSCVLGGDWLCTLKCRLFGQGAEGFCDVKTCICKHNGTVYVERENGFEPERPYPVGQRSISGPERLRASQKSEASEQESDEFTPEENQLKLKLLTLMKYLSKNSQDICAFMRQNKIDRDEVRRLSEKERRVNKKQQPRSLYARNYPSENESQAQRENIGTIFYNMIPENCELKRAPRKEKTKKKPIDTVRHNIVPRRKSLYKIDDLDDDDDEDDEDDTPSSNLNSKSLPYEPDSFGRMTSLPPQMYHTDPNKKQYTLHTDPTHFSSLRVVPPQHTKTNGGKSPPKIKPVPEKPGRYSFTIPTKKHNINHVSPKKARISVAALPAYTVQPAMAQIFPVVPRRSPAKGTYKVTASSKSKTGLHVKPRQSSAPLKVAPSVPHRKENKPAVAAAPSHRPPRELSNSKHHDSAKEKMHKLIGMKGPTDAHPNISNDSQKLKSPTKNDKFKPISQIKTNKGVRLKSPLLDMLAMPADQVIGQGRAETVSVETKPSESMTSNGIEPPSKEDNSANTPYPNENSQAEDRANLLYAANTPEPKTQTPVTHDNVSRKHPPEPSAVKSEKMSEMPTFTPNGTNQVKPKDKETDSLAKEPMPPAQNSPTIPFTEGKSEFDKENHSPQREENIQSLEQPKKEALKSSDGSQPESEGDNSITSESAVPPENKSEGVSVMESDPALQSDGKQETEQSSDPESSSEKRSEQQSDTQLKPEAEINSDKQNLELVTPGDGKIEKSENGPSPAAQISKKAPGDIEPQLPDVTKSEPQVNDKRKMESTLMTETGISTVPETLAPSGTIPASNIEVWNTGVADPTLEPNSQTNEGLETDKVPDASSELPPEKESENLSGPLPESKYSPDELPDHDSNSEPHIKSTSTPAPAVYTSIEPASSTEAAPSQKEMPFDITPQGQNSHINSPSNAEVSLQNSPKDSSEKTVPAIENNILENHHEELSRTPEENLSPKRDTPGLPDRLNNQNEHPNTKNEHATDVEMQPGDKPFETVSIDENPSGTQLPPKDTVIHDAPPFNNKDVVSIENETKPAVAENNSDSSDVANAPNEQTNDTGTSPQSSIQEKEPSQLSIPHEELDSQKNTGSPENPVSMNSEPENQSPSGAPKSGTTEIEDPKPKQTEDGHQQLSEDPKQSDNNLPEADSHPPGETNQSSAKPDPEEEPKDTPHKPLAHIPQSLKSTDDLIKDAHEQTPDRPDSIALTTENDSEEEPKPEKPTPKTKEIEDVVHNAPDAEHEQVLEEYEDDDKSEPLTATKSREPQPNSLISPKPDNGENPLNSSQEKSERPPNTNPELLTNSNAKEEPDKENNQPGESSYERTSGALPYPLMEPNKPSSEPNLDENPREPNPGPVISPSAKEELDKENNEQGEDSHNKPSEALPNSQEELNKPNLEETPHKSPVELTEEIQQSSEQQPETPEVPTSVTSQTEGDSTKEPGSEESTPKADTKKEAISGNPEDEQEHVLEEYEDDDKSDPEIGAKSLETSQPINVGAINPENGENPLNDSQKFERPPNPEPVISPSTQEEPEKKKNEQGDDFHDKASEALPNSQEEPNKPSTEPTREETPSKDPVEQTEANKQPSELQPEIPEVPTPIKSPTEGDSFKEPGSEESAPKTDKKKEAIFENPEDEQEHILEEYEDDDKSDPEIGPKSLETSQPINVGAINPENGENPLNGFQKSERSPNPEPVINPSIIEEPEKEKNEQGTDLHDKASGALPNLREESNKPSTEPNRKETPCKDPVEQAEEIKQPTEFQPETLEVSPLIKSPAEGYSTKEPKSEESMPKLEAISENHEDEQEHILEEYEDDDKSDELPATNLSGDPEPKTLIPQKPENGEHLLNNSQKKLERPPNSEPVTSATAKEESERKKNEQSKDSHDKASEALRNLQEGPNEPSIEPTAAETPKETPVEQIEQIKQPSELQLETPEVPTLIKSPTEGGSTKEPGSEEPMPKAHTKKEATPENPEDEQEHVLEEYEDDDKSDELPATELRAGPEPKSLIPPKLENSENLLNNSQEKLERPPNLEPVNSPSSKEKLDKEKTDQATDSHDKASEALRNSQEGSNKSPTEPNPEETPSRSPVEQPEEVQQPSEFQLETPAVPTPIKSPTEGDSTKELGSEEPPPKADTTKEATSENPEDEQEHVLEEYEDDDKSEPEKGGKPLGESELKNLSTLKPENEENSSNILPNSKTLDKPANMELDNSNSPLEDSTREEILAEYESEVPVEDDDEFGTQAESSTQGDHEKPEANNGLTVPSTAAINSQNNLVTQPNAFVESPKDPGSQTPNQSDDKPVNPKLDVPLENKAVENPHTSETTFPEEKVKNSEELPDIKTEEPDTPSPDEETVLEEEEYIDQELPPGHEVNQPDQPSEKSGFAIIKDFILKKISGGDE